MEQENTDTKEQSKQYNVDEVVSSFDFEEKVHAIQLDIGKMYREYPSADQLKIIVGAKGSSIRIVNLELLDKQGIKAEKNKIPSVS